ncbi:hypothetical protein GJ654_12995 [Rhodoblastus acidophilus]|uniref:Localization factor PodJL n=1 Tax=Rhodoblastus acidophilus TaxID=1074 RepID=A0A6N8DRU5_RHOAC|nr:SEL1-like repeat protein [Rhodoblastus acidophilus]MCW2275740.1 localization factor PodJL [Rhodoblastus acidophilus]MTV31903.1 hypothetical protein [Rhodoblastus acidophilus]
MSRALPWSIKGVDFDAREAAKEAARRDGLSLGQWMNRAIAERAAETGADGQDFDADERLEAVAAQLARLSLEAETGARGRGKGRESRDEQAKERPAPPQRASDEWDDPFGGELEPRKRPAREKAPQRQEPREPRGGARETVDAEALLEKAVAAFESRTERAEARAARALAQVAERIDSAETERVEMLAQVDNRLAELETHLRKKPDVEPLRGALGRLETRIEELARREPEPRDDETLRKLDRKLSNLISRVERAETAPATERDEHFARLEKRFDALLARLDRPAPVRAESARASGRRPDVEQAIAEISAHQRALDAAPRPAARPQPAPEKTNVFDERFDVLAQKLERIVQLGAAPHEDRRIDRLQSGIEGLSKRIEDMRGEFSALSGGARDQVSPPVEKALRDLSARIETLATVAAAPSAIKDVAGLRGELSGLSRSLGDLAPRGAVASLESAMRELANRVENTRSTVERVAQTRGGPETEELGRQLAEITKGLHDVAPRGAVAGVEDALRDLSSRIEAARELMARASERQPDFAPAFDALNRRLAEIGGGLSEVAPRGAVAALEEAVRDLGVRIDTAREIMALASERHLDAAPDFDALNRRLAEIASGLSEVAPRGAVAGLEDAMRDLSVRFDSTRAFIERAPAGASAAEIEALGQQVSAMSRALNDVAPRSQIAALELAVRELGARLERSRDEGLRDAVLAPIETLAADMRRAVADIGASANLDAVGRQIHALEEKIEGLRQNGAERGEFLNACDQSDALRASIAAALERMEPLERMERQVASLTDRLELLSRQSNEARSAQESGLARNEANWREIGSRLDDLAIRIDRAADQRHDAHPGEERRFDEISRRLDFMHQALAERIDGASGGAPQGQPGLEPLLRALADRLETAMAPQADGRAIEALERQMAEVTERLERGAARGNMQLQQALADLAARLEQGRESDREVAREVARETLREALAHLPGADGLGEQAAREIAELREKHEHSDRRAQQTLSAVHETLEKVVDRLAMLEEDVQETRAAVPAARAEAENGTPQGSRDVDSAPRVNAYDLDDPDSLLVEPGAGRPMASPAGRGAAEAAMLRLSREDEEALSSDAPRGANYIEVARRALAARAAADAQARAEAQRAPRGVGAAAERAKEKFARPLLSGEKRAGARTGMLLAAGASVLALGAVQLYRIALSPSDALAPATPAAVEAAPASAPAAVAAPAVDPSSAAAPITAPAAPAAPATVAPLAPATGKPAPGARTSLPDPLAVGSIGPRANMGAIQAGAQAASLQEQAEKGDVAAQFDLGARYADGRGLDRDPAAAIQWFEKAAAQGQAQAEYRLGVIYEKAIGVARDAKKARDYYEKAATQGHVRAMHNLAVIEAEGVDGKPNYGAAAQWFRRAAEYGVRDSQFNLAILYARGMGLTQNMTQSYVWFAAAANQGDSDAAKKRDEVGGRLSADELASAKKQASAFKARSADPAINEPPVVAATPRPQASAKI